MAEIDSEKEKTLCPLQNIVFSTFREGATAS